MNSIAVLEPKQGAGVIAWVPACRSPRGMRFRNDRTQLLVACRDDNMIAVIDTATLHVADEIPTGPHPAMIELAPDEMSLLVPEAERSRVAEIIPAARRDDRYARRVGVAAAREINNMPAARPFEKRSMLRAAGISMAHKQIEREIPVGADPEAVLAGSDRQTLLVASPTTGMVHVIDLDTGAVIDNIPLGTRPGCLLVFPGRDELWVSSEASKQVSIIGQGTWQVSASLGFRPPGMRRDAARPAGMTVTGYGATAIVNLGLANAIAFVDTATRTVQDYATVGRNPHAVALSADDRTLYLANRQSDDVSVIDMASRTVTAVVPVGRLPHAILVDD